MFNVSCGYLFVEYFEFWWFYYLLICFVARVRLFTFVLFNSNDLDVVYIVVFVLLVLGLFGGWVVYLV